MGELFALQAGIKLNHVGYKGSAPMHNDLLGGQILFAIDTLPQNVQFQKSGKLRLLAVTSVKRTAMAPDAAEHYHLPVKITPWGLSVWRGS